MTYEEAALAVIDALEALHIPCMVVGSFSSSGGIKGHHLAHPGTAATPHEANSFRIESKFDPPAIPTGYLFGLCKLWQEASLRFHRRFRRKPLSMINLSHHLP